MTEPTNRSALIAVSWLWVGIPFAYGVYQLILKVTVLFK